jgi:hypothetical protein
MRQKVHARVHQDLTNISTHVTRGHKERDSRCETLFHHHFRSAKRREKIVLSLVKLGLETLISTFFKKRREQRVSFSLFSELEATRTPSHVLFSVPLSLSSCRAEEVRRPRKTREETRECVYIYTRIYFKESRV